MTQNSLEAFNATKKLREKNEQLVFNALLNHPRSSRFCMGRITGLGDIEAQRRLSDLVSKDKVIAVGKRKHFKRNISLYSVKDQFELYPTEKKLTFHQYCKTREDWKHIYESLVNHKL
jgi:hypothetical protein